MKYNITLILSREIPKKFKILLEKPLLKVMVHILSIQKIAFSENLASKASRFPSAKRQAIVNVML